MIHDTAIPLAAYIASPTTAQLFHAHQWWAGATPLRREAYVRCRLEVVRREGGRHDGPTLRSFGTTGRPKEYRWGPGFKAVDDFFHALVFQGSRFRRAVRVQVNWLASTGRENTVKWIPTPGHPTVATVQVGVNNPGFVPKLRDALAGHDAMFCPSGFDALDRLIGLEQHLDRGSLLVFTGEPLPVTLRDRLAGGGWDVRDQMRSWDGGATFYTCPSGMTHWADVLACVGVDGERLVSTDLMNLAQPHIDYWNGDRVAVEAVDCPCGSPSGVRLNFQSRDAVPLVRAAAGMMHSYQTLASLLQVAADRAGAGPVVASAFGVEGVEVGRKIEIRCLLGQGADAVAVAAQAETVFRNVMGVEEIRFTSGIGWEDRKLRRIYILGEER